jgi:hypothetical protein
MSVRQKPERDCTAERKSTRRLWRENDGDELYVAVLMEGREGSVAYKVDGESE